VSGVVSLVLGNRKRGAINWRRGAAALAFAAVASVRSPLAAQTSPVVGVVFDSIHGKPLSNAFVTLSNVSGGETSDEFGRFRFAAVAPGAHILSVQHDLLDSIGLPALSRGVQTGGDDTVRIAVPSFATLWARFCGGDAPKDTAVVFGRVTLANAQAGVPLAEIQVTWADLVVARPKTVEQHVRVARVRTDTTGWYALCGVPATTNLEVVASTGGDSSGVIDLLPADLPIRRRDLRIGHAEPGRGIARGVVAGTTMSSGSAVAGARLVVEGLEARSGADGRFFITGVPVGTREVVMTEIGMKPATATVEVSPDDTAFVAFDLQKVVALDVMNVTASAVRRGFARDFEFRKKEGLGKYFDSTYISRHPTLTSLFDELPYTSVRRKGNQVVQIVFGQGLRACLANVLIDGRQVPQDFLQDLYPDDIAAMEVYRDAYTTPVDIGARSASLCGTIAIWTKRAFP